MWHWGPGFYGWRHFFPFGFSFRFRGPRFPRRAEYLRMLEEELKEVEQEIEELKRE